jgi:hypothetical protein
MTQHRTGEEIEIPGSTEVYKGDKPPTEIFGAMTFTNIPKPSPFPTPNESGVDG